MSNITLFAQIISKLCRLKFSKLVKEHESKKHSKGYNSWTHLVSMFFCLPIAIGIAKSQSVRDIIPYRYKKTFQDKCRAFLKKYNVEYDERYVWD